MKYGNLSLNDFWEIALKILEKKTKKNWKISIHITTDLRDIKGNVQGKVNRQQGMADILVSGMVKFRNLSKVIAHELVHLIFPDLEEEEEDKFNKEVEKIKKEIEEELKKRTLPNNEGKKEKKKKRNLKNGDLTN